MVLTDDRGVVRLNATVAWASFEIAPKSGPRYRAGIEFIGADAAAVDAYCARTEPERPHDGSSRTTAEDQKTLPILGYVSEIADRSRKRAVRCG